MSEVKGQGHTLIQVCSGVGIHFDTGTEVATICHYCQRALCKNAGREAKRKGTRESITGVHAHSASAAIYHSVSITNSKSRSIRVLCHVFERAS